MTRVWLREGNTGKDSLFVQATFYGSKCVVINSSQGRWNFKEIACSQPSDLFS